MMLFGLFLLAVVAESSLAQPSTATAKTSSTSSTPSIIPVSVGRGNAAFEPNNITANPGDIVSFTFYPTNHSVVRAAQGVPCQPYENIERGKQGFFSQPFTGLEASPTWNLSINDTSPIFFYCTAIDSCVVNKMIGAINANGTLLQQQEDAINENTTVMVYPGQQMAAEGSISSAAATASSTTSSSATSSTASSISTPALVSSSTPTSASNGSHVSVSHGAIAGIAVGAAVIIALVGALFWYMGRSRMMKKALKETQQQQQQPQRDSGFQHYPKDPSFGWGGDSDGRGSVAVSYAGSPPPDKTQARALDTVYDIERHGSPELDGYSVPEINSVTGYDERGRNSHRFSSTTSELGAAGSEPTTRSVHPTAPIHEIG